MSIKDYSTKTVELCNDIERISTLSSQVAKTLFSTRSTSEGPRRILPKNIETTKDSMLMALVTYCSYIRKEGFDTTDEDVPRDKIVDCDWQPAAHYFQGIIRGISGIINKKPFMLLPNKTPFNQGIWYVQSRLLKARSKNNLALKIPKAEGIFSYTSSKGKGLILAENIAVSELVNSVIDQLDCPAELWKLCSISPDSLKSLQILKHKRPSSKKIVYYKDEVLYLINNIDEKLNALEGPLNTAYKAVKDETTYIAYVDAIKQYNQSYKAVTKLADEIASTRYPLLFKKGVKGDQSVRLNQLDLDELNKLCPVEWIGCAKPVLYSQSQKDLELYLSELKKLKEKINTPSIGSAFIEWCSYVAKTPTISRVLRETGKTIFGFTELKEPDKPVKEVDWDKDLPNYDNDLTTTQQKPITATVTTTRKSDKKN